MRVATTGKAFKWEGVDQMKKMFNDLALALGPDGMGTARDQLKDVLLVPAMVIRDEAKDLAPVRTGNLRNSIYAAKGPDDKRGVIVGVNGRQAPYGRFVERGTSRMPAQPYFRPAMAATRPLVANLIADGLKPLIEGMASKQAYHP
jgi:HK97 gp10 family phage protein